MVQVRRQPRRAFDGGLVAVFPVVFDGAADAPASPGCQSFSQPSAQLGSVGSSDQSSSASDASLSCQSTSGTALGGLISSLRQARQKGVKTL